MSGFLDRLGRACARRHRLVLLLWVVAAIGIVVFAKASGGRTFDNFKIPDAQSQTAADLLDQPVPAAVRDERHRRLPGQERHARRLRPRRARSPRPSTTSRSSPTPPQVVGPVGPLASTLISKDGTIGLATVQYSALPPALGTAGFNALEAAAAPATQAGMNVQFGGPLVDYANVSHTDAGDSIGLLISIFILVIAFGSIVAAGLPIATALFGLAIGISAITLLAAVTDVGTVAPDLATMIGLGVGIDYSLFIVTRHRENLRDGMDVEAAIGRAVATAGQAVIFAGTTVVIAICGLALSGIPYVAILGYSSAMVVAVMMLAAITLLPALLGFAGRHVNSLRVRGLHIGHHQPAVAGDEGRPTFWARFATRVADHRWPSRDRRGHRAPDVGRAVPLDPVRPARRRHRAVLDDPAPGLRAPRGRLRPRCQRTARRRGHLPAGQVRCHRLCSRHCARRPAWPASRRRAPTRPATRRSSR